MNCHLEQTVYQFLQKQYQPEDKLLIALSGGADSLTLYQILLNLKKRMTLHFAVAHVDHSWRAVSRSEALELKKYVEADGVDFHLHTLDLSLLKGNLECAFREQRLAFFKRLVDQNGYHAVLMGHHADDQAETVLKRIFEGAGLENLSVMQSKTVVEGLPIWRPLLTVPKKDILLWAETHRLHFFEDETNKDTHYLRARFRQKVIPFLNTEFGKQITSNLCRLSKSSKELEEYLDVKTEQVYQSMTVGPLGWMLGLNKSPVLHSIECKHLLKRVFRKLKVNMSRDEIDNATQLILEKKANKQLNIKNYNIYIDRSRLFILIPFPENNDIFELRESSRDSTNPEALTCSNMSLFSGNGITQPLKTSQNVLSLDVGTFSFGNWKISISDIKFEEPLDLKNCCDWQKAWIDGRLSILLPHGKYQLLSSSESKPVDNNFLSKWWNNAKVPAFLRSMVPIIANENGVVHEFLSGKRITPLVRQEDEGSYIKVVLELERVVN